MDNNFLSMEDLSDVIDAFKNMPDEESDKPELTPEELASQKRYEEIIKKHKSE